MRWCGLFSFNQESSTLMPLEAPRGGKAGPGVAEPAHSVGDPSRGGPRFSTTAWTAPAPPQAGASELSPPSAPPAEARGWGEGPGSRLTAVCNLLKWR